MAENSSDDSNLELLSLNNLRNTIMRLDKFGNTESSTSSATSSGSTTPVSSSANQASAVLKEVAQLISRHKVALGFESAKLNVKKRQIGATTEVCNVPDVVVFPTLFDKLSRKSVKKHNYKEKQKKRQIWCCQAFCTGIHRRKLVYFFRKSFCSFLLFLTFSPVYKFVKSPFVKDLTRRTDLIKSLVFSERFYLANLTTCCEVI